MARLVPAKIWANILASVPTPWVFGPALFVCTLMTRIAKWVPPEEPCRLEDEKDRLTRSVGGYSPDNVTTICLFYELLYVLGTSLEPQLRDFLFVIYSHFILFPFRLCPAIAVRIEEWNEVLRKQLSGTPGPRDLLGLCPDRGTAEGPHGFCIRLFETYTDDPNSSFACPQDTCLGFCVKKVYSCRE